jgi:hypothetical protein
MRRFLARGLGVLALMVAALDVKIASSADGSRILLFADVDDDNDNGIRDGSESRVTSVTAEGVHWFSAREVAKPFGRVPILSPVVRFVADGQGVPRGAALPPAARRIGLQGLAAGRTSVLINTRAFEVSVVELAAMDAHGTRVDLVTSHASISRVLPSFLSNDDTGASDQDALRWLAIGEEGSLPEHLEVVSFAADGEKLDALSAVELWELPCPTTVTAGLSCRATALLRATADRIDRGHPESSGRSLRAEVGGKLAVKTGGRTVASIRVGGPRLTSLGPIERLRARLNVHVLRAYPGGSAAVGSDDASALQIVRSEVRTASLLWGQCGVTFGKNSELQIALVDPPPPYLLSIGCSLGLPASGGELRFRVGARAFRVSTRSGETPDAVAEHVATALRAVGLGAAVSHNPRIEPGALGGSDVLVREGTKLATLEPDGGAPLSTDPSLTACIASVELGDGLSHFTDSDALAGTLEERAIVLAYADHDPASIDVFVVPAFSGNGRVGESFLDTPGAVIRNSVIVDRAAIFAGARSHVLAHEIGHVLLDMPGHPDDYGVDQPTALMDSDATDPSIFGPRRLSIEECERALRERGPKSQAPLLEAWPLVTGSR